MDHETQKLIDAHRAQIHSPPDYLVHQWHHAIDQAAELERGRSQFNTPRWLSHYGSWGAGATAALAIGIAIGWLLRDGNEALPMPGNPALIVDAGQGNPVPPAFTRGLQVYLRDSQQQLANLSNDGNTQLLVEKLIEQNRLFESAADLNHAPDLARVLRSFELILRQLAASDIAPEDAEVLRAQLAFELNVVLTKLAHDSSKDSLSI
jgi:hypothetical protein